MATSHKVKIQRIRERLVKEGKIRMEGEKVVSLVPRIGVESRIIEKGLERGEVRKVSNGHGREFMELNGWRYPVEWNEALVKEVARMKGRRREFVGLCNGEEMIGRIEGITKERKILVLRDSRWKDVETEEVLRIKKEDVELGRLGSLRTLDGELVWRNKVVDTWGSSRKVKDKGKRLVRRS